MNKLVVFLGSFLIISIAFTSCKKDPPVASFNCDKTNGLKPLTVNFTSTSTGEITLYSWDFGDGVTSTSNNTSHTYNNAGTFFPTLTVTGPGGSNSANNLITVIEPVPVANFTCNKTSGDTPLTVQFTSTSTGSITSYSWNFGDGGSSTSQNPSHTYNNAGTFTVILTVTGPGGSSSSNVIITTSNPESNITFYNKSFTKVYVTIGLNTKTVTAGSSVTFSGLHSPSAAYSAYTYGVTTSGAQIGLKQTWNGTLALSGGSQSYNLNIGSGYFFLYITNKCSYNLYNLYVNKGLISETYDNIVVYNNGVKVALGYYAAYTNSNVYMYNSSGTIYWKWVYGTNFTFPFTVNQSISLTATTKSTDIGNDGKSDPAHLPDVLIFDVLPAQSFIYKDDPNAIDLYSK